ncbi:MAG: hypothetical protein R3358_05380 [Woeseiaceae bacterium]|nr:hypothetical protein [Woeseiaceae bacterium]
MANLRKITLTALLLGMFSLAGAQNLDMQGTDGAREDGRPVRGSTMASVEAKFGSPSKKHAAVGEPPITRWEYNNMVVFFEHDRVIHAVLKR